MSEKKMTKKDKLAEDVRRIVQAKIDDLHSLANHHHDQKRYDEETRVRDQHYGAVEVMKDLEIILNNA